jgi:DNA-directed RNA polymerase specialized sigma24 family protein
MAYTILRNKEDAEDAVQDALLSAYVHLRAFEGRSALTTWFSRIVLNASFMIRRKWKSSHIEFFPEPSTNDDTSWIEKVPTSEPDPEISCTEGETLEFITAQNRARADSIAEISAGNFEHGVGNSEQTTHPTPLYRRQAKRLLNARTGDGNAYAVEIADRREERN